MGLRVFEHQKTLPVMALLIAMAIWGSSFVAMKYSFRELHPLAVIFGRMLVALLCFIPFLGSLRRISLSRRHLVPLALLCLCEPCLYFLFEAAGLMYTSASQASMISTMLPLMVALSAGFFLGEQVSQRAIAGFIIAACGSLWLGYGAEGVEEAPRPLLGNLLEFMAMICATGYTICLKHLSKELHPFHLAAIQVGAGTFFFAPAMLSPQVREMQGFPGHALLAILYLGVVVSFGAYSLYNYGVSRIPASQASAFINLIPVFSILLAFLLLDERLNFWQLCACGLVFAGVLLSQEHPWGRKSLATAQS